MSGVEKSRPFGLLAVFERLAPALDLFNHRNAFEDPLRDYFTRENPDASSEYCACDGASEQISDRTSDTGVRSAEKAKIGMDQNEQLFEKYRNAEEEFDGVLRDEVKVEREEVVFEGVFSSGSFCSTTSILHKHS